MKNDSENERITVPVRSWCRSICTRFGFPTFLTPHNLCWTPLEFALPMKLLLVFERTKQTQTFVVNLVNWELIEEGNEVSFICCFPCDATFFRASIPLSKYAVFLQPSHRDGFPYFSSWDLHLRTKVGITQSVTSSSDWSRLGTSHRRGHVTSAHSCCGAHFSLRNVSAPYSLETLAPLESGRIAAPVTCFRLKKGLMISVGTFFSLMTPDMKYTF